MQRDDTNGRMLADATAKAEKIKDAALDAMVAVLEKEYGAAFDKPVENEFRKSFGGMIRKLYVTSNGYISHEGIERTLKINASRPAKKARPA